VTTSAPPKVKHPAKFTPSVVLAAERIIQAEAERLGYRPRLLDSFAGPSGRQLPWDAYADVVLTELEHVWTPRGLRAATADALHLPFPEGVFHLVVTSPCYGNRFADKHDARDGSTRRSYTHDLRATLDDPTAQLTKGSAGALQWGPDYRAFHEVWIREQLRVLVPGGLLVVNMSNHYRDREEQRVVEWWCTALFVAGCRLVEVVPVATQRLQHGANTERADSEKLIVVRAPSPRRDVLL
jgi:SAM-dependent methyltransferase